MLASRILSLRAFDARAMMVDAKLVTDGGEVGAALDGLLASPAAASVHIHYAISGCYAARAERV